MFWADEIVSKIIETQKKDSYLITDGFTPSGHAHVGSLRGPIIHEIIKIALNDKNKKAIFQLDFEDYDPMDGLPFYIDKTFQKYMGIPLCNIPAPNGKLKNYAEEFIEEFENVLKFIGLEVKTIRMSKLYQEGKFNDAIRIILDNAESIRKIYKQVSGSDKGGDWFPLQVVCPKCGKIGTTRVTDWNSKEVRFKCEENLVEWAKGCGYEGSISPFDGKAKMPWKVEWAAKWFILGSDIEGEGKDHFAAGGSRDVADAIARKIFKIEPPFDIRYEHFLVGGAKMSSSKGLGVTAKDMADFLPANILRFLFIRTRYNRAIDFKPEGEAIPLLYDEYDRIAALYNKDPKSDLARAFYYAELDPEKSRGKYLLRFSKIAYMLQMPRADILEYAQKEKGSELLKEEKEEIKNRTEIAKKWLEKFALESYKFTIQKTLPKEAQNLSKEQKDFLSKISDIIKSKEAWTGEDLHKEIHEARKKLNIDPRQAFSAIYLVFIGKDSGPQAGWLLASLEKDFVLKRLEEII